MIPFISSDKWYQSLLPHISIRRGTPLIILPDYWKHMMHLTYTSMIKYQQSTIHHDLFEVRATPYENVGQGLYVRNGMVVPSGHVIEFWGMLAPLYNPCLARAFVSRQIPLPFHPHFPARFFTHPACLAGFVNSTTGSIVFSDKPNCILLFDESNVSSSPCYMLVLKTTRRIVGDGTESSQLLFTYE